MANLGFIEYNIKVLKNISVKTFRCTRCRYLSKSIKFIEDHVRRHNLGLQLFDCERSNIECYSCVQCHFETFHFMGLKQHTDNTADNVMVQNYTCKYCKFKTIPKMLYTLHKKNCLVKNSKFKSRQKRHTVRHKLAKHQCDYNSFNKDSLKKHISSSPSNCDDFYEKNKRYVKSYKSDPKTIKYGNTKTHGHANEEVQYFRCDKCEYKTKERSNLKRHIIRKHTKDHEIQYFLCDKCDHKTKDKDSLKRHIIAKHTDEDEVLYFHCDKCDHKTKHKFTLKKHKLIIHANEDEVQHFHCDKCDYKTKLLGNLKRHILTKHTNEDEIKYFYCGKCDHKTKDKKNLKRHIIAKHMDENEVQYFHCDKCDHKTKRKEHLRNHIFAKHTHEDKM